MPFKKAIYGKGGKNRPKPLNLKTDWMAKNQKKKEAAAKIPGRVERTDPKVTQAQLDAAETAAKAQAKAAAKAARALEPEKETPREKAEREVLAAIARIETSEESYQAMIAPANHANSNYGQRQNVRLQAERAKADFGEQWRNVKLLMEALP